MVLAKSGTCLEANHRRLLFLAVAVLAVALVGCAGPEKDSSSVADAPKLWRRSAAVPEGTPCGGRPVDNHIGWGSEEPNLAADSDNDVTAASDEAGEEFGDEDFDLLAEELEEKAVEVGDPLEPLNRVMFGFNDVLYFWVLKPCAQVCKDVVPEPGRVGIRNFFNNLTTPIRLANCLLQGKDEAASRELDRFIINTTVGVLGFGDPARDQHRLEPADEDLGQTLATYGVGDGFYLVLPLLGPSTLRDAGGKLGDSFLNPVFYVEPAETAIAISAGNITNEYSFHIGEYESFKAAAVDPYVALREAYLQYRKKRIEE